MPTHEGVEVVMKALVEEYWGKTSMMTPDDWRGFTVEKEIVMVPLVPMMVLEGVKVGVTDMSCGVKPEKT